MTVSFVNSFTASGDTSIASYSKFGSKQSTSSGFGTADRSCSDRMSSRTTSESHKSIPPFSDQEAPGVPVFSQTPVAGSTGLMNWWDNSRTSQTCGFA